MLRNVFSFRFILFFAIAVAATVALTVALAPSHEADAAVLELHGWAWSSNIGWIGFNCADVSACGASNYKVTYDNVLGNLSGYAWSSSIGWVWFNPAEAGCPAGACPPKVALSGADRQVTGWARACTVFVSGCSGALKPDAERGGWDGWIELSGANHTSPNTTATGGVTYQSGLSKFIGKAWGGDPIGWLDFNQVTLTVPLPLPEADIKANNSDVPITISSGSSATLTWCGGTGPHACANATSCSVSPGGWTTTSGTQSVSPATSQTYTLTCTNATGSTPDTVTVNVTSLCGNGVINPGEQCDNGAANGSCPATCSTSCTLNACVAADFTVSSSNDIEVNFTPALVSTSKETTITITPSGGFASPVSLRVSKITDGLGNIVTPPNLKNMIKGFLEVYNPVSPIEPPHPSATQFSVKVHKSNADPDNAKVYTLELEATGGTVTKTVNIMLTLKASDTGGGEQ